MPVYQKDSEVYDAIQDLESRVNRLMQKTGLAAEDQKASEQQKAAEEKASQQSEQPASEPEAPKPESEPKPAPKSGGASR